MSEDIWPYWLTEAWEPKPLTPEEQDFYARELPLHLDDMSRRLGLVARVGDTIVNASGRHFRVAAIIGTARHYQFELVK